MQQQRFCLDRGWRFTKTPHSVLPRIITHDTVYGYAKGDGAQGPAMLNFNDADWLTVDLPHDWQHTEPVDMTGVVSHGYQRTGVSWYRRTFLMDAADAGGEVFLTFDGISGISDVYVNGAKLRHNESCYNGFTLRLTDILNFGATPNVIAVRVDKTSWEGWWYEGCGINRHVWLHLRPWLHLAEDGVWVKPVCENGAWRAELEWTLENGGPDAFAGTLTAEVTAPDGSAVWRSELPVGAAGFSTVIVSAVCPVDSPVLWDIDMPRQYTLRTALATPAGQDEATTRFGLRETRFDANEGFFLNGRPLKLFGVCNHLDHAGIGTTIPRDLWRYRVQLLKGMGCNAYRCSHNPPPPELLDVCDELGLLVMDENRSFSTSEAALELLRAMVRRDRNHPSVILYSLFNEEPMQGTSKGRRIAMRQRAEVRRLDDTRACMGALNGGMFEPDGAATALDVTGVNYFLDSFDRFHALHPDQPMLSSETVSAFATRGCVENDTAEQVFGNYDKPTRTGARRCAKPRGGASQAVHGGLFVWTALTTAASHAVRVAKRQQSLWRHGRVRLPQGHLLSLPRLLDKGAVRSCAAALEPPPRCGGAGDGLFKLR
jgi:beta-galactosidase